MRTSHHVPGGKGSVGVAVLAFLVTYNLGTIVSEFNQPSAAPLVTGAIVTAVISFALLKLTTSEYVNGFGSLVLPILVGIVAVAVS